MFKKKAFSWGFVVSVTFVSFLCGGAAGLPQAARQAESLTETAGIQDVSCEQAHRIIQEHKGNPNLVILDFRTKEMFDEAHIEGAVVHDVFLPDIDVWLESLDKNKVYLIYCTVGHRSGIALNKIKELKFGHILHMAEGLTQWKKSGYETVSSSSARTTPQIFAPGIVSTPAREFFRSFTPNGQESLKPPQDRFVVPDVVTPKTERMVDVGGRKLHVRIYGQGAPSVFFVSGTGNAPQETWNPLIDPLAAEATLITYDRAGIGKSEIGDLPTHARQSAEDLRQLLKELNPPKPVLLVGHSYGVMVVKLFASLFPDEVGGLVLIDGVPSTIVDAQKKILTGADLDRLEKMTNGAMAPPHPRTEMDYSLESRQQELKMGPLPRVPVLVLIAGANREAGVPPGFSPEARRKMAQLGVDLQKKMATDLGGRFIVFDNLGHLMHLEKPEPIILAIKDMIQSLRSKSSSP
jgi:pimeloyl-ACP methyl ester carboxylesterase/rhodanese-related sulfurtransferase